MFSCLELRANGTVPRENRENRVSESSARLLVVWPNRKFGRTNRFGFASTTVKTERKKRKYNFPIRNHWINKFYDNGTIRRAPSPPRPPSRWKRAF